MVVGPGYHDYGIRAINGLIHDETGDYIDNPMFPRKAICDFEVNHLSISSWKFTLHQIFLSSILDFGYESLQNLAVWIS